MEKKVIIICLDGTGNQVKANISNVLKLYRVLKKDETQIVYYDQGVGTIRRRKGWGRLRQFLVEKIASMGFGIGLDIGVLRAYEFLIDCYEEGDEIFLFGYSRGAHTARVLAAMLYVIGLLRPEQKNLSGAALTAYKSSAPAVDNDVSLSSREDYEGEGPNFRRVMKPRTVSIRFMGLWDTVSSVMVPNYKGFFFPPLVRETLPYTSRNPAVREVAHAVSIDEKRRFFRLDKWEEGQEYKPNLFSVGERVDQIHEQRWFAGFHGDVGGGNPRKDSGLSQFSLIWMIEKAMQADARPINEKMIKYVTGQEPYSDKTKYLYPKPDIMAKTHPPFWGWGILEIIPKLARYREWAKRWSFLGLYLPLFEPRWIAPDDIIDPSAYDKREKDPNYNPVNWP